MRTLLTLKNTYWGIISQVIILLIGFITRKIFLITLGTSYLGLNSLFTNVISLISLAELGISGAIIYHLYKPFKNNDKIEIAKLMNLYKDTYRIIAGSITIIGISFIPFIEYVINDSTFTIVYTRLIFCIFLFDTVVSYFFSYKRSIIFVDQKNYIILVCDTTFRILIAGVNIVVLVLTNNFIIYLLSSVALKLLNNFAIAIIADKKYPYIKSKEKLEQEKRKEIFINIKDIFINKLSWTITSATDNLIISIYFNLSTIGLIANYNLIILSLQTFVTKILESSQASVGNLLVQGTSNHIYIVLKRLNLLAFFVASLCGVCLFVLINPFISIWIGQEYLVEKTLVAILICNFFLFVVRLPLWQMMGVSGLFKQEKNIALIGTGINLVISLGLVRYVGLSGVFLGTLISILVQIILKIPLFFNEFLKIKPREYFYELLRFVVLFLIETLIAYYISSFIQIENLYLKLIVLLFICLCVPIFINYLVFKNTDEFKYLINLIRKILSRKKASV